MSKTPTDNGERWKRLEQAGWHDYFEQVNARGELLPPPEALGDMVQLQREPA